MTIPIKRRQKHLPVLLAEVIRVLSPQPSEVYIDATAGYGGHARAILAQATLEQAILIDQDISTARALKAEFAENQTVKVFSRNFREIDWEKLPAADMILFDLGVNSAQLDTAERGFSFRQAGPLDMRMNINQKITAADVVNGWSEAAIANCLFKYGEERRSRVIAAAILRARQLQSIDTTTQLTEIIHRTIGNSGKIDSATKTFQALRIAVNNELQALEETLPKVTARLKPGGRLAIISFHSLEDRMIKRYFRQLTSPQKDPITGQITTPAAFYSVTKKPLLASATEIDSNPRARSAKLRAIRAVENQN